MDYLIYTSLQLCKVLTFYKEALKEEKRVGQEDLEGPSTDTDCPQAPSFLGFGESRKEEEKIRE